MNAEGGTTNKHEARRAEYMQKNKKINILALGHTIFNRFINTYVQERLLFEIGPLRFFKKNFPSFFIHDFFIKARTIEKNFSIQYPSKFRKPSYCQGCFFTTHFSTPSIIDIDDKCPILQLFFRKIFFNIYICICIYI